MARILVVEDNAINMKYVIMLLQSAGHTTLSAGDGEAGVALARAEIPDLILMDIELPGMDGLAATKLLKEDPATAAIPVIAVTAMTMENDRYKSVTAGCDGYIAKPFRHRELYGVIDSFLLRKAPT